MMKKVGYSPTFAGGVEAVASSGGQMMPPVMGIAAFLIANIVGIPYSHLALKALFPASLFFFSIFLMVDFEARKRKLKTIPREALPSFKEAFRKGGYFVIPLVVIVGILISGYSPIKAALWGIICVIVLIFFNKETRPNPVKIIGVFEEGAVAAATIAPAAACAGILITAIFHSGIGLKFSNMIMVMAGNSLFAALVLSAVGAMILGMGMPTFFVYMTLYALILPGLINLGAEPLSIHMFVFYYGVISCITPPVAFAAFAASTIADSPPMRTGFYACYIGMAKYLVPFMFVFNPELLLIGETSSIVFVLVSSLLGITALTAASSGYLFRRTSVIERILLLAATATLISPDLATDLAGYILFGLVVFIQLIWKRTPVAITEAAGSSEMTD
jgi:TRAP transporter 4TM/12TM fusion protein